MIASLSIYSLIPYLLLTLLLWTVLYIISGYLDSCVCLVGSGEVGVDEDEVSVHNAATRVLQLFARSPDRAES